MDPPDSLNTLAEVEEYIATHGYWTSHQKAFQSWREAGQLTRHLQGWHARHEAVLANATTNEWTRVFSGKEILRHLRSHVAGLDDTPARPPQPTPADRDLNLAKRIARKMRDTGRIPSALTKLRDVLRAKAGLAIS